MKRVFSKYFLTMMVLALSFGFTSCSSDDDDDTPSTPTTKTAGETLAGTYAGKLWNPSSETYDVTLTVTDLKNGKIKVSTNKGNTTPKEITVKWNGDKYIVGEDENGIVSYTLETKLISVTTKKTSDTDVQMFFEGKKN